jgi:hypothetical protein
MIKWREIAAHKKIVKFQTLIKKKRKKRRRTRNLLMCLNFSILLLEFFCSLSEYIATTVSMIKQKALQFLGFILPGYIVLSGLIILSVEMHIGFICRNMKFLYNYFGRGFFNIYAGIMPLALIDNNDDTAQEPYFKVIIYVIAALMGLIGALYIVAKVCCCAK